jgi:hypothetical protein
MMEAYWTVAGSGGAFCDRCADEAPRCTACRRPALDGIARDGRFFCRECAREMVDDAGGYERIYDAVIDEARIRLGLELGSVPPLVVADRGELVEAAEGSFSPADLCGIYERDPGGRAVIRILSNLPEPKVAAVLAHEIAHAWQAENCPDDQGERVREGFAEWVAWKVLAGTPGGGPQREIIEARSDEYGMGFRLFRGIEGRQGSGGALRYARAARSGIAAVDR